LKKSSAKNFCEALHGILQRPPAEKSQKFFAELFSKKAAACLIFMPFLVRLPQWLLHLNTDPICFYAWAVAGARPGVLPGWPYLDVSLGAASEALGTAAARDWVHGIVPWWDPYTGIGMPLAGQMLPEAFFLPFNLLLLLHNGLLWQLIAVQIVAGFAMWRLLLVLGVSRVAALAGGLLYELDGVAAWSPGPAGLTTAAAFLPLLVLGIELMRENPAAGRLAVGVAIFYMVAAGFPEAALLGGLLALGWAAVRCTGWRFAGNVALGGVLGLLVAAPLLISFADLVAQSGVIGLHDESQGVLNRQIFAMTFLPYVTGEVSDAHGSLWMLRSWANIGGYTGVLLPLLALFGLRWRSGIKIYLVAWLVVIWGRSYGVPPFMWAVNHLPLMHDVVVWRYGSASCDFALVVLAAFGLDALRTARWPFLAMLGVIALAGFWALPWNPAWRLDAPDARAVCISWRCAMALASLLLGAAWVLRARRGALAALLVLEAAVLFAVPQLSGVRGARVEIAEMRALHNQAGLSRIYTIGPVLPNYGAYFQVASLDHNVIPAPKRWDDYIDAHLFPGIYRSYGILFYPAPGFYGPGAGLANLQAFEAGYRNMGVRYVLDYPGADIPFLHLIYRDAAMEVFELPNPAPYFSAPGCTLTGLRRERVTLDCPAPATLLRRELFMPGWHATINNRPAAVLQADDVFQSVAVPAGRSVVRFGFTPPFMALGWVAMVMGLIGLGREGNASFLKKRSKKLLIVFRRGTLQHPV